MKKLILILIVFIPMITIGQIKQEKFTTGNVSINNSTSVNMDVEWNISDSLVTYTLLGKQMIKRMQKLGQPITFEYKCALSETAPNYYVGKMNIEDTKVRIKVILTDENKPVVSMDMLDSFTEVNTNTLYF